MAAANWAHNRPGLDGENGGRVFLLDDRDPHGRAHETDGAQVKGRKGSAAAARHQGRPEVRSFDRRRQKAAPVPAWYGARGRLDRPL